MEKNDAQDGIIILKEDVVYQCSVQKARMSLKNRIEIKIADVKNKFDKKRKEALLHYQQQMAILDEQEAADLQKVEVSLKQSVFHNCNSITKTNNISVLSLFKLFSMLTYMY